jgi:hypothetical protein
MTLSPRKLGLVVEPNSVCRRLAAIREGAQRS